MAGRANLLRSLPERLKDSHKGDYGRILIVAGSPGLTGAAALCAEGALRSGAGLVTVACPAGVQPILATKLTEAMTFGLEETTTGSASFSAEDELLGLAERSDVLAIGPGLSRNPDTLELVRKLVKKVSLPIVLDADALYSLPGKLDLLAQRHTAGTIATPHPGELAAILGTNIRDIQARREETAAQFAAECQAVCVLKGYRTVVSDGTETYVNKTGNPGMATGGSGDVLTGAIAALVGCGMRLFDAACAAAYVHGLAGDLAAKKYGQISMKAGDIVEMLPGAFKACRKKRKARLK